MMKHTMTLILLCALPIIGGQEAKPGDTLGWHVVKPGETLKKITEHYLGDGNLWPENHRLNPTLRDPDLLRIGQRLRVITARERAIAQAELVKVVRDVKRRNMPRPWEKATRGDLLKERDGVRTLEKSAAQLRFEDGTSLNIREDSLLFLTMVERNLRGIPRESVEVVTGQVELKGQVKRPERLDVELVMGGTRAKPATDKYGNVQTRGRMDGAGTASVMVFGGKTKVSAAGASVTVPKGMGTVVEKGAPPQPPKKLLNAPKPTAPKHRAKLNYGNPRFDWGPVAQATSYTLEVCRDAACATPVLRYASLASPSFAVPQLPEGKLFWRITAVDSNALDGFPSRPRPLEVRRNTPDTQPPVVVAYPVGRGKALGEAHIALGKGARIRLAAADDASGVAKITYRWNEGNWRTYQNNLLKLPGTAIEGTLWCKAVDKLGRESNILEVRVTLDTTPPEGPSLRQD